MILLVDLPLEMRLHLLHDRRLLLRAHKVLQDDETPRELLPPLRGRERRVERVGHGRGAHVRGVAETQ